MKRGNQNSCGGRKKMLFEPRHKLANPVSSLFGHVNPRSVYARISGGLFYGPNIYMATVTIRYCLYNKNCGSEMLTCVLVEK